MTRDPDRFLIPHQQSFLMMLGFHDEASGRALAAGLESKYFDEVYSDIAERLIVYYNKYRRTPGPDHIDDVLADLLDPDTNKKAHAYQRVLGDMADQYNHGAFNADFIVSKISPFVGKARRKHAMLNKIAPMITTQGDDLDIDEVDRIWREAAKPLTTESDDLGGSGDDDERALRFLDRFGPNPQGTYSLGIAPFDRVNFAMTKQEMLIVVAPTQRGKSWFLIHCGKMAMVQHANVLHITLEMSEERILERYHQTIYGIARRNEVVDHYYLEIDRRRQLTGLTRERFQPELYLGDPEIHKKLLAMRNGRPLLNKQGRPIPVPATRALWKRLKYKVYPTGQLTIPMLNAHLDRLELIGWTPDVLIVDYGDLMKVDPRNKRIELGAIFEDLRGIAVERHVALVTATQSNRESAEHKNVKGTDVAEDWSKMMTADSVLTLNQTDEEKDVGLMRLFIEKSRNDVSGFGVLISTSYETGQFILGEPALFNHDLLDNQLKRLTGAGLPSGEKREDATLPDEEGFADQFDKVYGSRPRPRKANGRAPQPGRYGNDE